MVKYKSEEKCRNILETLFNSEFPSVRPDFLKNPETKRKLELDCYNEELKLALEYSGKQHYIFPNHFHKTKEDFLKQIRRDDYKKRVCIYKGVKLIVVPY